MFGEGANRQDTRGEECMYDVCRIEREIDEDGPEVLQHSSRRRSIFSLTCGFKSQGGSRGGYR